LVLVDDGWTDGTAAALMEQSGPDDRVTVIQLARSFGSHYAISAGLARCAGDCAIVPGADLQEPPSLVADFSPTGRRARTLSGVRRSRVGRSVHRCESCCTACRLPG
jgi:dolichol-phosphate mannosyltransferase